jgi:hypothetical protein
LPNTTEDEMSRPEPTDDEWEKRWDELFARSHELLEEMADEALREDRAGQTLPVDPNCVESENPAIADG